jgi:hypothetical protein
MEEAIKVDLAAKPLLPRFSLDRWCGGSKRRRKARIDVEREFLRSVLTVLDGIGDMLDASGGVGADKALRDMESRLWAVEALRQSALHVCAGARPPQHWDRGVGGRGSKGALMRMSRAL